MATNAGTGIERLKAVRFRGGCVDRLPDIDPDPAGELGKLVDEGDVHCSIGVFEKLRELGDLRRLDRIDVVDEPPVYRGPNRRREFGDSADDLRVFTQIGVLSR